MYWRRSRSQNLTLDWTVLWQDARLRSHLIIAQPGCIDKPSLISVNVCLLILDFPMRWAIYFLQNVNILSSDTSLHCQPNGMCKHCKHFIWLPAPLFWIHTHKFLKINQWEKPPQYFVKRNRCLQKVYQVVSISIRFKRSCSLF